MLAALTGRTRGAPASGRMARMSDDWRLTVTVHEGHETFIDHLHEANLEDDVRRRLGGRVAVSQDGPNIFFYADSEQDGRDAQAIVASLLARHKLTGTAKLERWHPTEERWEDPAVPLPQSIGDLEQERQLRDADEQAQAREHHHADFEVRVHLTHRDDAIELEDRMRQEGRPVIRRFHYVLVGASDEDDAAALADRLRIEAPQAAEIIPQGSAELVRELSPPSPFAIFGGLAT